MPLNVHRASIGLHQAAMHEFALERADRAARAAEEAPTAAAQGPDVHLDVRLASQEQHEVMQFARAEQLVQSLRADTIGALRGLHAGLDPNRVAALLAD